MIKKFVFGTLLAFLAPLALSTLGLAQSSAPGTPTTPGVTPPTTPGVTPATPPTTPGVTPPTTGAFRPESLYKPEKHSWHSNKLGFIEPSSGCKLRNAPLTVSF